MGQETIAVIAAHPDDEVLGFGGIIARTASSGGEAHILIMATGIAARGKAGAAAIKALREQGRRAAKVLGAASIEFLDFPDNRMDTVPLLDVVQSVERYLEKICAETVFTHHAGDLNVDHQITARAALTAFRPTPGAIVRRLYAGEVLSSSEYAAPEDRFRPNTYIDVGASLAKKCAALACYTGELRGWPHPRSAEAVEALAKLRGSECGREAAEAFILVRETIA